MAKKNYCEDERLIGAFLNNFKMVDIVKETGLTKDTLYRIKKDPDFQRVLRERKDAIIKTAVNKMQGYLVKDVEILQKIAEDPETSAQIKINAIQTLMSQLRDWTTTSDIVTRLEALEKPSVSDDLRAV